MKNAFVTGASQGIGKEFVKSLSQKYNVYLIARKEADLMQVVREFEPGAKGFLKALSIDLSKKEDREKLRDLIASDENLGMLVNNAGFGTVGQFCELPLKKEIEQINVNIKAVVELSHAALANFKKQKSGNLINVASIAGYLPAPGSAIYAATKSFVKSFTESLHEEMKDHGIKVQALCPGLTHSDFHQRAGIDKTKYPNFMWQSSETVVRESLESLERNEAVCITGTVNQSAILLTELMPRGLVRKFSGMLKLQDN